MIANPATPSPAAVPHRFSLNDLLMHSSMGKEPSSNSSKAPAGPVAVMGLAVVLAIGVFIWLDPMHWFTPTETSPPSTARVPSAETARPTVRQEITAPPTPSPATQSVDVPIAPAPRAQAPRDPAPVVRPRAARVMPESRDIPMDKTNATVQANPKDGTPPPALLSKPEEVTAAPALLTKPEEKPDMPIVPKAGDDTRNAPTPPATAPVPD